MVSSNAARLKEIFTAYTLRNYGDIPSKEFIDKLTNVELKEILYRILDSHEAFAKADRELEQLAYENGYREEESTD